MIEQNKKVFRFEAVFGKITTCKEGGIKLTLDVSDVEKKMASELMHYDTGYVFDVIITVNEAGIIGQKAEE